MDAAASLTLGARGQAGAGARKQDGRWLFGEATAAWARPAGPVTAGVDASAFVLRYRDPYDYDAKVVRLHPGVSASTGRVQFSLRGDFARGDWSSRYADTTEVAAVLESDGETRIDGLGLSATSFIGVLNVEAGVALRDATNGTRNGRYATLHLAVSTPLGPGTAFATLRIQDAAGAEEAGAEVGGLLQLGDRTTLIALLTRSVTDPLYGTRSGPGVSVGASVRLHATQSTDGVAAIGPARGGRRSVTLRVQAPEDADVSVAGSFNAWTPVAMRQDGEQWTLTLHLEPGSYTFAFRRADGTWFLPEDAPGVVDDGFGQKNATLVVPPL